MCPLRLRWSLRRGEADVSPLIRSRGRRSSQRLGFSRPWRVLPAGRERANRRYHAVRRRDPRRPRRAKGMLWSSNLRRHPGAPRQGGRPPAPRPARTTVSTSRPPSNRHRSGRHRPRSWPRLRSRPLLYHHHRPGSSPPSAVRIFSLRPRRQSSPRHRRCRRRRQPSHGRPSRCFPPLHRPTTVHRSRPRRLSRAAAPRFRRSLPTRVPPTVPTGPLPVR